MHIVVSSHRAQLVALLTSPPEIVIPSITTKAVARAGISCELPRSSSVACVLETKASQSSSSLRHGLKVDGPCRSRGSASGSNLVRTGSSVMGQLRPAAPRHPAASETPASRCHDCVSIVGDSEVIPLPKPRGSVPRSRFSFSQLPVGPSFRGCRTTSQKPTLSVLIHLDQRGARATTPNRGELRQSSLTRVYLLIQFTSQVFPPSSENACSDCAVSAPILQMENRTSTDLPLISS